jgi:hypothetical protein
MGIAQNIISLRSNNCFKLINNYYYCYYAALLTTRKTQNWLRTTLGVFKLILIFFKCFSNLKKY